MKAIAIIPARYHSTRLPGKVLLQARGKYLVQHTYERVLKARRVERVIVATDDRRILKAVRGFGGEVMLTSHRPRSGTERVAEVSRRLKSYPLIVNVQADEPEINPVHIDLVIKLLRQGHELVTLACPISRRAELFDPNKVKIVLDQDNWALYFSRTPIPYCAEVVEPSAKTCLWRVCSIASRLRRVWRDSSRQRRVCGVASESLPATGSPLATESPWATCAFLRHLGIYGYQRAVLLSLVKKPPSPLERLEKLEQLRALENGWRIKVGLVKSAAPGIDTPQDYQGFLKFLTTDEPR